MAETLPEGIFPFPGKGSEQWKIIVDNGVDNEPDSVIIHSNYYWVGSNPDYYGAPQIYGHTYPVLRFISGPIDTAVLDPVATMASGLVIVICNDDGNLQVVEHRSLDKEGYQMQAGEHLVCCETLQPDRVQEPIAIIFRGSYQHRTGNTMGFVPFKQADAVEIFAVHKVLEWLL